ncbi:MAG: vanadium-dependent haloperoxidase [Actinomycetota bacterium]|nr:vanadium-dependent haloperoxidase [Actinomycetota bacterium]
MGPLQAQPLQTRRKTARRAGVVAFVVVVLLGGACSDSSETPANGVIGAEPRAGQWKTWVVGSPERIKVAPPPEDGSPEAEAELEETRRLAGRRTPQVEEQAHKWGDYPMVEPWIRLNMQLVAEQAKNPPLAARGYGLVSTAMHDAAIATWHWKYVYRRDPPPGSPVIPPGPDPSYPSEHAAIAGAASRVLAYLFPERPEASYDEMADEAAESVVASGTNFRSDAKAGLDLGRAVADAVIARGQADGSQDHGSVNRPVGVGSWEAPPDNPGAGSQPVEPKAGTWKTWAADATQIMPGPPPAFGSPRFMAEVREVYDISQRLTEDQKRIAKYWEGGRGTPLPPGVWNQIALDEVRKAPLMSTPRLTRTFALLNAAQADAGICAWATKYKYFSTRPVNAIRDLGIDQAWKPLLPTPVFPSYVSGHSTFSAASAEVLAYLFPAEAARFRAMAEEAGMSRIYAGIHYPADNVDGLMLGKDTGAAVVQRAREDGADARS